MRFFVPPSNWLPGNLELVLDPSESKHAVTVLRLKPGDTVTVFDGAGRQAAGRLMTAEKREVRLQLTDVHQADPIAHRLVLAVAIPKGSTMEWIIEKAVELGVSEIIPLLTQRTVVRLDSAEAAERRDKWHRVAIEACKQCGQNWLPRLHPPQSMAEALSLVPSSAFRWPLVACLQPDALPLPEAIARPGGEGSRARESAPGSSPARSSSDALVWIGPEGDFTPDEYSRLRAAGVRPVSLGPIVLRVETAALYTLSVLRFCAESGNF